MAKQLWPISGSQNPKLKADRMMWHGDRYLLSWEAKELSWTFPSSSSTLNPAGHQVILFLPHLPFPLLPTAAVVIQALFSLTNTTGTTISKMGFWSSVFAIIQSIYPQIWPRSHLTWWHQGLFSCLQDKIQWLCRRRVSRHDLALPHRGSQSFLSCWAEITLVQKGHWSRSEKGVPFLVG